MPFLDKVSVSGSGFGLGELLLVIGREKFVGNRLSRPRFWGVDDVGF